MNNQTNTHQGTNVEHLLANSLLDHPRAWQGILESIGQGHLAQQQATVAVIGGNKRKGDVVVTFPSDTPIRVTVKSFSGAGYNHLERRNLEGFCNRNQISVADTAFLTKIWLRKAKNSGKGQLVQDGEYPRVRKIFDEVEPAVSSILGNDHPQIMALYSVQDSTFHLYNIEKQVLPLLRNKQISITGRGGNIAIGNYIVIQRKGSAAGESGLDIYAIRHGSNHIQIKMKTGKFFNEVEPASWYKL